MIILFSLPGVVFFAGESYAATATIVSQISKWMPPAPQNNNFMPELPEVETIKNGLKRKILHKNIEKIEIRLKRIVKNNSRDFLRALENNKFKNIERRGKLLIFSPDRGEKFLLIHLKMTGQLIYCRHGKIIAGGHGLPAPEKELPGKYSHVIFDFSDGSRLFFNDLRQFGYLRLVGEGELAEIKEKFGPEPLSREFSQDALNRIMRGRRTGVKAVLLNQHLLAGIGNIYADEILFAAGISPNRRAAALKKAETEKIFKSIKRVLKKAVKYRGTTFNNYIDADGKRGKFVKFLQVYGREGKKCRRCRTGVIKKIRVAGRGTRYCPFCQK